MTNYRSVSWGIFFLAICTSAQAAQSQPFSQCRYVAGQKLSSSDSQTALPPHKNISAFISVFDRISRVASSKATLLYCDSNVFNASAEKLDGFEIVKITKGMVEQLRDENEIAMIIGHEFAHLQLDHKEIKQEAIKAVDPLALAAGQDKLQKTGDLKQAQNVYAAIKTMDLFKLSRDLERQADEKGFSLAYTLGGYDSNGAKTLTFRMAQLSPIERPSFLSTHPGFVERHEKAGVLSANQKYLESAKKLHKEKRWKELATWVDQWIREAPDSGAAWYYKGLLLVRAKKPIAQVASTFEKSVSRYVGKNSLGALAQEDQEEASLAWLNLCVALYDEGYSYESANCSRRITHHKHLALYKKRTFGEAFVVAGPEIQRTDSLWAVQSEDGSKFLTNDLQTAENYDGAPIYSQWKAIRYGE